MRMTDLHHNAQRPLLLDLFCCAGGAAKGYHDAGFDVFGVDIVEQPNYPYPMMVADATALTSAVFDQFDAVHASPPCQAYSDLAARNGNADEWPQLIESVRDMLKATDKPYVIENVDGAPLRDYVVLCGTMFDELRVLRHRLFESNFNILTPPHRQHPLCHTLDKRKAHYGKTDEWKDFVSVNGGGNCSVAAARDAMSIPWMTKKEINEAIPPAYTRWIGEQLKREVGDVPRRESIKSILKALFLANKGKVLTSAQLQAAIGDDRTEWARRVRELRRDEGWPIETNNDNADLKSGQYRLAGDPPPPGAYEFHGISQAQRSRILERNGYTCQACGAGVEDKTANGRPVRLVIDHHEARTHGGATDDANLRVLCQECNGGAKDFTAQPPTYTRLMATVRRAKREDQIRVLEQLEKKFRQNQYL